jgi:hypothetical protein
MVHHFYCETPSLHGYGYHSCFGGLLCCYWPLSVATKTQRVPLGLAAFL